MPVSSAMGDGAGRVGQSFSSFLGPPKWTVYLGELSPGSATFREDFSFGSSAANESHEADVSQFVAGGTTWPHDPETPHPSAHVTHSTP